METEGSLLFSQKSAYIIKIFVCINEVNLAKFNITTNMTGPQVVWSLIY